MTTNWREEFDRLFPFAEHGRDCCIEPTEPHDTSFKTFITTHIQKAVEEERERIRESIEGERLEHKPDENCRVHEACEDCAYNAAITHSLQHVTPPNQI